MTYLSWAASYEGPSDAAYLDVLLPRLMETIIARGQRRNVEIPQSPAITFGRNGRKISAIAEQACADQEAFRLLFVHADTGGRGVSETLDDRAGSVCRSMSDLCAFPGERCIPLCPRHEIEAWVVADGTAVCRALGYRGTPRELGLPTSAAAADRLTDPKAALGAANGTATGSRRKRDPAMLFPAIAQSQDFAVLAGSPSFAAFQGRLWTSLAWLGVVQPPARR